MKTLDATYGKKSRAWLGITLLILCCSPALAFAPGEAKWSGVVTHVVDGDTVWVRPASGGKPVSIRVDGIDAPEICQAGGSTSRDVLKRQSLGRQVIVHGKLHDDYGRLLAQLNLDGEDLGAWMVEQGQAWSYRYRQHPGPYAAQQRRAQAAGRGLFSPHHAPPPLEPRLFRKQHGSCRF